MPTDGPAKSFGFVQTFDTKPKRRLFEVLKPQGMQMKSAGNLHNRRREDVRDLPLYLNPQAEHLIDWFHITMRLTVMCQMTRAFAHATIPNWRPRSLEELERLKWFLWHGNVFRALQTVDDLQIDLDNTEQPSIEQHKLLKIVTEFRPATFEPTARGSQTTVRGIALRGHLQRVRRSAVNQVVSKRMVKKQQMRWRPRVLTSLLQVRAKVLNDELAEVFRRWYPAFVVPTESA